ncbi:class I SAM-dependent methyltransferase [Halioglobus pacificus]|uniref:Methyltransferase type 11 domain-containing protein n=1 Tax=Parahalioglobus pacificus TaxID=930806 RepID=A0A918XHU4_9GAMM|nr:class I SAM-dependent methyltransferase [Halioglobus pacificus]GHD31953.1 hypothetical protein GCM10007053_15550 [Halioglobus pacificus]
MQKSIYDFIKICAEELVVSEPIYEFGSLQVMGKPEENLRPLFPRKVYVGADMRAGPGVDIELNLHAIELPDNTAGSIICADTLEHVEYPRKAVKEMFRVLKPGGVLIMTSLFKFPIHDYPNDFWRFTPEGFKSLMEDFVGVEVFSYGRLEHSPQCVVTVGYKGVGGSTTTFNARCGKWSDWNTSVLRELHRRMQEAERVVGEGERVKEDGSASGKRLSTMSESRMDWIDDMSVRCDDVKLSLVQGLKVFPSTEDEIVLFKDPKFVDHYLNTLEGFRADNVIEVGVWDGGSAIFFWNLLKPDRLSCVELKKSVPPLEAYISRREVTDSFRLHTSTDQSDKQSLGKIVVDDFGGNPLDLIIDDASHLYGPSKATFEALFPHLRPGGLFILEDWKAGLIFPKLSKDGEDLGPPLHRLVHEILQLSLLEHRVVASIKCVHNFVVIERGHQALNPEEFKVPEHPEMV